MNRRTFVKSTTLALGALSIGAVSATAVQKTFWQPIQLIDPDTGNVRFHLLKKVHQNYGPQWIYTDKPFDYVSVGDQIKGGGIDQWMKILKIVDKPATHYCQKDRTLILEVI